MNAFERTGHGPADVPAAKKPWNTPTIIVSTMHDSQKLSSNVGFEYHETDGGGGGTTQVS